MIKILYLNKINKIKLTKIKIFLELKLKKTNILKLVNIIFLYLKTI